MLLATFFVRKTLKVELVVTVLLENEKFKKTSSEMKG
jgi:hypothetical protein